MSCQENECDCFYLDMRYCEMCGNCINCTSGKEDECLNNNEE